jgi:LEA14-like dessication related protein
MHRVRRLGTLVVVLSAVLFAGCTSAMVRQPEVTLEGVQLGGLGLRGGTLLVDVQVVNPNRFALNANQLQYELALREPEVVGDTTWVDFAAGTYAQPFSVGAGDTARIQIPVEFTYSGLGAAAGSILNRGTFAYRAIGTVDVRTPLGTHEVPFQKRGTVTLLGSR